MDDLVTVVGLGDLLDETGVVHEGRDFEALYDELTREAGYEEVVVELERRIHAYFSELELPDRPTTYDYLLASLRPKDLVATFNWDPLLAQAYRRNLRIRYLPRPVFLHGNVAAGCCPDHRRCGWIDDRCGTCGEPFQPTPLLYPVRDKDYAKDPFIASEWRGLHEKIARAYFLTVFGYSAPATDAAARAAMIEAWKRNAAKELAEVEIIDVKNDDELRENWKDFITRTHYLTRDSLLKSYVCWHPRRSCDALAMATLQNMPWKDDWLSEFDTIEELHAWIEPLLAEEEELNGTSRQFTGRPCGEHHEVRGG